jgi:phosphoribosylformylglycinamidine synthase
MTLADVAQLFRHVPPRELAAVDVLGGGRRRWKPPTRELGLALSDDELDYLVENFVRIGRNPTDVELMMFAQANSEHCRHKIFNASWVIDGAAQAKSLFGMIRDTHAAHPEGTVVAYSDNSSVIEGATIDRFYPRFDGSYAYSSELTHVLMKVETHNHPTAISPFPGAATGSGGEIRDEGATGIGSKPKAGLAGFSVSNLSIFPASSSRGRPAPTASPNASSPRSRSCSKARSARRRSTTNSAAPTWRAISAPSRKPYRRAAARLPQAHHAGGRRRQHPRRPRGQENAAGRHAADPAGRPRHADRAGRRRRLVDGHRRQRRRPRLRFGAARQPGNGTARAGGHRPLLAAGRQEPRSCRSTTSAPAASPTRCPNWCTAAAAAAASNCAPRRRKSPACRRAKSGATRRRSAMCWRSRRAGSMNSVPSASVSAARLRYWVKPPYENHLLVTDSHFQNAPVDVSLDVILGKPPKMTRDVVHQTRTCAGAACARRHRPEGRGLPRAGRCPAWRRRCS